MTVSPTPTEAADHERIWLQNAADGEASDEGRMWCQDKVWPVDENDGEPTEYVRADIHAAALALIDAQRARATALEAEKAEAVLAEREACAKVAEDFPAHEHGHLDADPHYAAQQAAHEIAATIRARRALAQPSTQENDNG